MSARVVFLWHMHQPEYRDPESGQPLLPWVRLHTTRAYNDMAAMLERFPEVRCVVNWAPSLLLQLEAYVSGAAVDLDEVLAIRATTSLSSSERAHVLKESFSVDWDLWVKPVARYHELLSRRGYDLKGVDLLSLQESFSDQELLDLQVHFLLAWMGFSARRDEPVVAELLTKERGFSEGDKRALLEVQRRIAQRLLPRWAQLAARGQVELTCSPLFHPILPLLIDSDSARRALPDLALPPRFAYPQDAALQVTRGLQTAARFFGVHPQGMWPSEGSVSPEVAELFCDLGVKWIATDADNLRRSERAGNVREPLHFRPWIAAQSSSNELAIFFRDRDLSDRLGFRYAKADPAQAANDLLGRVAHASSPALDAEGGAVVTLALDGENPWEHYPRSGEDFLTALYSRLSAPGCPVTSVLPREELLRAPPTRRIARLHSGSWIESSFRIWIGHAEDNEAWTQLGLARAALAEEQEKRTIHPDVLERAQDALLAAEGSDWFWWYGDDFTTENAAEFDALFRRRIAAAFRLLGRSVPERVNRPIIAAHKDRAAAQDVFTEPMRLIDPVVDGFAKGYFEWQGAGTWRAGRALGGSMHVGRGFSQQLWFGFSLERFFLRLDPDPLAPKMPELLALTLGRPTGDTRLTLRCVPHGPLTPVLDEGGRPCGEGQCGAIVELQVQLAALGLSQGDRFTLSLQALRDGVELERLPRAGALSLWVPDRGFEQAHWQA